METVKQKYGSKDCVAYCAAMAFDIQVEEFKNFKEPDSEGNYSVIDFIRFGLTKGFYTGYGFIGPVFNENESTFIFEFDIHLAPALIIVESDYEAGAFHTIVWDGQKVHDPNPAVLNKKLSDYAINAWYPILKITN